MSKGISDLPFRARLAIGLLYPVATGLAFAAGIVSMLDGSVLGTSLATVTEILIIIVLIRRALSCNHHPVA